MKNRNGKGWTLAELLVALTIASLLATLAVHAYQSSILRSRRGLATRALADFAARQEDHYLRGRGYAADFAELLERKASVLYLSDDGPPQTEPGADSRYAIRLQGDAQHYVLEARAVGSQLADTPCQVWTLDSLGIKTASGGASDALRDCWP